MWPVIALELGLSAWVLVLLVRDLISGSDRLSTWKLAAAGLLLLGGIWWWQQPWVGQALQAFGPASNTVAFPPAAPMFVLDPFAHTMKALFLLTALLVVVMLRSTVRTLTGQIGAFYLLLFSALLGMLVLASAHDLLMLFIGLELLTFSLYVMVAYLRTDARSVEAGLKYLIMGSISSGFLVYGVALLYGMAGGTNFEDLRRLFESSQVPNLAIAGLLLVVAGLGFKIAAVPFHLWAPDVYEGAPTPVVALLSVGSKMAGFVALLRLLYGVCLPVQELWGALLAVMAGATMCYGNLAAIPQTNIKRLLGYSSIGHAGYLLMGLCTATNAGAVSVGYYLLAYLVSNLAVFFVVILVSESTGSDSLDDYKGLAKRSPLLAAVLFLGLLSLAGAPPLAGFSGKLLVLLAAMEDGKRWLVLIGALNVAIALYYYLMIIRRMYFSPAVSTTPIRVDGLNRSVLLWLSASIVLIGLFQEPFLSWLTAGFRIF